MNIIGSFKLCFEYTQNLLVVFGDVDCVKCRKNNQVSFISFSVRIYSNRNSLLNKNKTLFFTGISMLKNHGNYSMVFFIIHCFLDLYLSYSPILIYNVFLDC